MPKPVEGTAANEAGEGRPDTTSENLFGCAVFGLCMLGLCAICKWVFTGSSWLIGVLWSWL